MLFQLILIKYIIEDFCCCLIIDYFPIFCFFFLKILSSSLGTLVNLIVTHPGMCLKQRMEENDPKIWNIYVHCLVFIALIWLAVKCDIRPKLWSVWPLCNLAFGRESKWLNVNVWRLCVCLCVVFVLGACAMKKWNAGGLNAIRKAWLAKRQKDLNNIGRNLSLKLLKRKFCLNFLLVFFFGGWLNF